MAIGLPYANSTGSGYSPAGFDPDEEARKQREAMASQFFNALGRNKPQTQPYQSVLTGSVPNTFSPQKQQPQPYQHTFSPQKQQPQPYQHTFSPQKQQPQGGGLMNVKDTVPQGGGVGYNPNATSPPVPQQPAAPSFGAGSPQFPNPNGLSAGAAALTSPAPLPPAGPAVNAQYNGMVDATRSNYDKTPQGIAGNNAIASDQQRQAATQGTLDYRRSGTGVGVGLPATAQPNVSGGAAGATLGDAAIAANAQAQAAQARQQQTIDNTQAAGHVYDQKTMGLPGTAKFFKGTSPETEKQEYFAAMRKYNALSNDPNATPEQIAAANPGTLNGARAPDTSTPAGQDAAQFEASQMQALGLRRGAGNAVVDRNGNPVDSYTLSKLRLASPDAAQRAGISGRATVADVTSARDAKRRPVYAPMDERQAMVMARAQGLPISGAQAGVQSGRLRSGGAYGIAGMDPKFSPDVQESIQASERDKMGSAERIAQLDSDSRRRAEEAKAISNNNMVIAQNNALRAEKREAALRDAESKGLRKKTPQEQKDFEDSLDRQYPQLPLQQAAPVATASLPQEPAQANGGGLMNVPDNINAPPATTRSQGPGYDINLDPFTAFGDYNKPQAVQPQKYPPAAASPTPPQEKTYTQEPTSNAGMYTGLGALGLGALALSGPGRQAIGSGVKAIRPYLSGGSQIAKKTWDAYTQTPAARKLEAVKATRSAAQKARTARAAQGLPQAKPPVAEGPAAKPLDWKKGAKPQGVPAYEEPVVNYGGAKPVEPAPAPAETPKPAPEAKKPVAKKPAAKPKATPKAAKPAPVATPAPAVEQPLLWPDSGPIQNMPSKPGATAAGLSPVDEERLAKQIVAKQGKKAPAAAKAVVAAMERKAAQQAGAKSLGPIGLPLLVNDAIRAYYGPEPQTPMMPGTPWHMTESMTPYDAKRPGVTKSGQGLPEMDMPTWLKVMAPQLMGSKVGYDLLRELWENAREVPSGIEQLRYDQNNPYG